VSVLLYLALGIFSDLLVTGYYLSVSRGLALPASLLSIPIAMLNFWIIGTVVVFNPSLLNAGAYALGNAIGCYMIMRGGR
jgi:hypothetical protein